MNIQVLIKQEAQRQGKVLSDTAIKQIMTAIANNTDKTLQQLIDEAS